MPGASSGKHSQKHTHACTHRRVELTNTQTHAINKLDLQGTILTPGPTAEVCPEVAMR